MYNASNPDQGIEWADILSWSILWNGTAVSGDIIPIGGGLYLVSLTPITVAPGDDPILLNMTISAIGYEDKHYETYFAVDPETIDKGPPPAPPPSGDGDDDDGAAPEELPLVTLITIVGASVAAGCVVIIIAWKKELFTKLKRK